MKNIKFLSLKYRNNQKNTSNNMKMDKEKRMKKMWRRRGMIMVAAKKIKNIN